jgi:hypothetical protein
MKMMLRSLFAVAFCGLAFTLTGCGGATETAASGASGPGAAAIVPADAAAFVSLNTDGGSAQRRQLRELVGRFPGADDALQSVLEDALGPNADWSTDVEPALGPELALAFVPKAKGPVLLTQPDDLGKLEALVHRAGGDVVTRDVGGWRAIGATTDLDAFEAARGGESLADSQAYADALDGLPDSGVAKLYASGNGLQEIAAQMTRLGSAPTSGIKLDTGAAVVEATSDGLRLQGRATTTGSAGLGTPYKPTMLDRVPDDAFVAISFGGLDEGLAQLRSSSMPFLPQVEQALGVTLDDLGALFRNEGILYARSGIPIPEVTLALKVDDEQRAKATVRAIAERLAGFVDGKLGSTQIEGIDVTYVEIQGVRISFAAFDGTLLITSGIAGLRDFRRDGSKLADDDAFVHAAEQGGLGDTTSGFLYVDVQEALPVAEALANLAGQELPTRVRENLDPLGSLFLHASADGSKMRFGGLLAVR